MAEIVLETWYMSIGEFEQLLEKYFEVRQKEEVGPMIQYFLVNQYTP